MKVHNDLKELLEDFCENYLERKMLDIDLTSKQIINDFASSNSLALGKPEPLAKNKQTDESFYCDQENRGNGKRCKDICDWCNEMDD